MTDKEAMDYINNTIEGVSWSDAAKALDYILQDSDENNYYTLMAADSGLFDYIHLYAAYRKEDVIDMPTQGIIYEDNETIIVDNDCFFNGNAPDYYACQYFAYC